MSEQFKYKSNTGEDRRQALLTEYMVREQARRDKEALLDLLGSESGRWFLMRMLDTLCALPATARLSITKAAAT